MINKIATQYNIENLKSKRARKYMNPYGNFAADSDNAKFSTFAVQLSKYANEMKNIPDVREEIVNNLKTQFENDTYTPPLNNVAEKLILSGFIDVIE